MTDTETGDLRLGTARAGPGESARGYLDVTELPTGTAERLPVILANGAEPGPTLWITGSIHGDEATGLAVAQDAMADGLHERIEGQVVCLPNLNPAGLRRTARTSYYHDDDPNRYFPDPGADSARPPRVQELIDGRLYALLAGEEDGVDGVPDSGGAVAADALISLHTASVGSVPFNIRDRVRYGEARTEPEAEELAEEADRLLEAFGVPVVTAYPAGEQEDQGLQRSIASAALNLAGVPAFTPELGSHSIVEEDNREAGVVGTRNVMRAMDVLPGDPEPNDAAPEPPVDFPVRRRVGPHADTAGIVRHRVGAGDPVAEGDPVADVVSPHGEHRETVRADHDGYVLGRAEGVAVYENDPVTWLAVRGEGDLVVSRDGGGNGTD